MLNYLKLYRFDVFIVTAITAVCGYYLTYGTLSLSVLYLVLFISGILYNYVYVLNALTDIEADRINKPERPLPSGKLSYKAVLIYIGLLGLIAILGFIFFFKGFNRHMVVLVLFIGAVYSIPPIELKKIPIVAPFITGWGLVHPMFITGKFDIVIFPAVVLTCYSIGTTFLKDLSDIEGDLKEGRKLVTNFLSVKKLLIISMIMTSLAALFSLKLRYPIIGLAPFSTFLTTLYFYNFKKESEIKAMVYKKMILSVAIVGSIVMTLITTGLV